MFKSSEKQQSKAKSNVSINYAVIDENVTGGLILVKNREILKIQWEKGLRDAIENPKTSVPIQIRGFKFENGVMMITLANEACVPALENMVNKMGELWKDCKLAIVPEKAIPKFYKVTFKIPDFETDYSSDTITKFIGQQNEGLNVDLWTLLRKQSVWMSNTLNVVYAIDYVSSETLGESGELFFMSSMIPYTVGYKYEDDDNSGELGLGSY